LRVYAHVMRRSDDERAQLRALVEGRDWALRACPRNGFWGRQFSERPIVQIGAVRRWAGLPGTGAAVIDRHWTPSAAPETPASASRATAWPVWGPAAAPLAAWPAWVASRLRFSAVQPSSSWTWN